MNILIVKLSSIGDVIHALPAVAAVRESLPDARISWAVEKGAADMLSGSPAIDDLIHIDTRSVRSVRKANEAIRELTTKYKELREREFDVAIDFQGLIKSAAIAKLSGAARRVGFSKQDLREPASRLLLTDTVTIPGQTHVIKKNLLLAEGALGFKSSGRISFPISTSQVDIADADRLLARVPGEFAILNPAGGWPTKLWPAENFGRLADLIWSATGLTPVIVTGPKESALAEKVRRASSFGRTVFIRPKLKTFFEIARRSKVYIGGDTGPTHIAAAAGAPTVGIFGPTEWWRNGSLDPDDICVERTDIPCRVDCHRRSCSNWICLDMTPDTVLSAVTRRLEKK